MKIIIFLLHLAIATVIAKESVVDILQLRNKSESEKQAVYLELVHEFFDSINVPHEDPKELEKRCKKDSDSFNAAINADTKIKQCFRNITSRDKLEQDISKALAAINFNNFFSEYCPKNPEVTKCFENYIAELGPCLEPSKQEEGQLVWHIVKGILEFTCDERSSLSHILNLDYGLEWMENHSNEIKACLDPILNDYQKKVNPPPGYILNKVCSDKQVFYSCMVAAVNKRNEPTAARLLESLYNHIKKHLNCKEEHKD